MAAEKSQNVQDVFLNNIRKNKIPVTIFLVNGVKLQGIVTWFDNFSVLLRRDAHSQLVYKHAISTVMPATPVQLFEGSKDGEEEPGSRRLPCAAKRPRGRSARPRTPVGGSRWIGSRHRPQGRAPGVVRPQPAGTRDLAGRRGGRAAKRHHR